MASLGTLTLNISANLRGFTRGMKQLSSVIEKNQAAFQSIRNGAAVASASLGILGATSVRTFAQFESSMTRVASIADAKLDPTGDVFRELSAAALDMAATTQFSAREVAEGMEFMARAGNKTAAILEQMPAVLDLAAAGALDLGAAADISTNIVAGMGIEASKLGSATDVMVKAFTSANTDLLQLGEAFKFVGPVANAAGIQFEEVTAVLGLLGNAGIQASMAGTTVRGAITKLLNPTAEGAAIIKRLGVEVTDSAGKMLPFADILEDLSPIAKDAGTLMALFGQRAGPGMAALLAVGSERLREFTKLLEESSGITAELREKQMKTLQGALLQLASTVEAVQISFGAELAPAIRFVADVTRKLVGAFLSLSPGFKKVIVAVGALTFVMTTLLAAFAVLGLAIPGITASMALFSTSVTATVVPALLSMAAALGLIFFKVTAVLAVLGAVAAAAFVAGIGIQKALEGKKFDLVFEVKESFGRLKGALADLFVVSSEDVEKKIKKAGDGISEEMNKTKKAFEKQTKAQEKFAARTLDFSSEVDEIAAAFAAAELGPTLQAFADVMGDVTENTAKAFESASAATLDFSSEADQQAAAFAASELGPALQGLADVMNDVTENTAAAFNTASASTLDFSSDLDKAFVAAEVGPVIQAAAVKAGIAEPKKPSIKEAGVDFAKGITGSLGKAGQVIQSAVQGFAVGGPAGPFLAMFAAIFEIISATKGFDQIVKSLNSIFQDIVVSAEPLVQILSPIIRIFSGLSSLLTNFLAPILLILGTVLSLVAEAVFTILFPFLLIEKEFGLLADATEAMRGGLEEIIDSLNKALKFFGREPITLGRDADDTSAEINEFGSKLQSATKSTDFLGGSARGAASSIDQMNEELSNVPSILKVAQLRFESIEAEGGAVEDRFRAIDPSVGGGGVFQGPVGGDLNVNIEVTDEPTGEVFVEAMMRRQEVLNYLATNNPNADRNRTFGQRTAR